MQGSFTSGRCSEGGRRGTGRFHDRRQTRRHRRRRRRSGVVLTVSVDKSLGLQPAHQSHQLLDNVDQPEETR